jgi:hypothetical protein
MPTPPLLFLAAAGGTVAYFAFGFIVFGALPYLRNEYARYPAVLDHMIIWSSGHWLLHRPLQ